MMSAVEFSLECGLLGDESCEAFELCVGHEMVW